MIHLSTWPSFVLIVIYKVFDIFHTMCCIQYCPFSMTVSTTIYVSTVCHSFLVRGHRYTRLSFIFFHFIHVIFGGACNVFMPSFFSIKSPIVVQFGRYIFWNYKVFNMDCNGPILYVMYQPGYNRKCKLLQITVLLKIWICLLPISSSLISSHSIF